MKLISEKSVDLWFYFLVEVYDVNFFVLLSQIYLVNINCCLYYWFACSY